MTMEQAALEVNHWCHEHVAYRAADSRTSAPLATLRTSLGRCGEESTFAVTALRSVGIPARQCYTPRWAHCDDNHAWVEVWVANPDGKGGEWKFLGACEPDPELNMGWFAVPSTRCLMVHSKAFGRYHGDEEVVKQTALYSELNLLSHYAPTRRVTATVCGPDGKLLPGATIKFKMYNYAEYYTLATYQADAKGQASLTTGLGDILVWATDGTRYAFSKLDVRQDSTITLTLSDNLNSQFSILNLDIVPPAPGTPPPSPPRTTSSPTSPKTGSGTKSYSPMPKCGKSSKSPKATTPRYTNTLSTGLASTAQANTSTTILSPIPTKTCATSPPRYSKPKRLISTGWTTQKAPAPKPSTLTTSIRKASSLHASATSWCATGGSPC